MKKHYLLILIIASLVGCNNNKNEDIIKQQDYENLQRELAECKKNVEELSNTPQMRLVNGQQFLATNDFINAKKEFNTLIERYQGTEEANKAILLIAEIEKKEKEQKEAEERKRTLGYKALQENISVKVGDVTIKFNTTTTGKQWVFDNYGYEYRYRSAEREEIYILSKVSISSDVKDPKLPPIVIYEMSNGILNLIGMMDYEFTRWKDYGTYLGNNADFGNDFAHTQTISFSCGLSVSNSDANGKAIFVVVKKENCFNRKTDRFSSPPVAYVEGNCNIKPTLTVDDFDSDYVLIKILNKGKL